jgi:PPM family protein phosphatase
MFMGLPVNTFVDFAAKSAVGLRHPDNQDRILTRVLTGEGVLLAVADGMGGAVAGGLASEVAIRFLEQALNGVSLDPEVLAEALQRAGEEIASLSFAREDLEGMGTTLTVVAIEDGKACWAHVGDSRLYHFGAGGLRQVSRDHRFLQDLIDCGDVTPEELPLHPLRNVLDQCLGCPALHPDSGMFHVGAGDLLLLTSDGVHDHVLGKRMIELLRSHQSLEEIADALIAEAKQAGSTDDVSAVLGRVMGRT